MAKTKAKKTATATKPKARSTRVDPRGARAPKPKPTADQPITFIAFAAECGVALTDAQRVLCMVSFDNVDPVDLDDSDRAIAAEMFGAEVERIPADARRMITVVAGRGSGKSYILLALRALHLAVTLPLRMARRQVAHAFVVAPDLRTARETVNYARGAAESIPSIARMIESEDQDGFIIRRRDGNRVRIGAYPATAGGSALRSRTVVFAGFDELAFFRDSSKKINDEDIVDAPQPRLVGQSVACSTPWAQTGLLYRLHREQFGAPTHTLVVVAPTELMRAGDPHMMQLVAIERQRDPDRAAREYDCSFLSRDASSFFGRVVAAEAIAPATDAARVYGGCDLGFVNDASALVLVRLDGDSIIVVETREIQPSATAPLIPSVVCGTFARAATRHGCTEIASDAVYRESAREHLQLHGIGLATPPAGARHKVEHYERVRHMIAEGRLVIPASEERLLAQLAEVTATATAGGGTSIDSPRRRGSHGDLVSALVAAVWLASWHREIEGWEGGGCTIIDGRQGIIYSDRDLEREREQVERERQAAAEAPVHFKDGAVFFSTRDLAGERQQVAEERRAAQQAERELAERRRLERERKRERQRTPSVIDAMISAGCAVPEGGKPRQASDPFEVLVAAGVYARDPATGIYAQAREPQNDAEREAMREL